jgi:ferredoxin--NADP+ reductase
MASLGDLGIRGLSIPGAELAGVTTASSLRAWLAGHPEHSHDEIDLRCRRAVVIGDSDGGLDVAAALALARSPIEEVVVIGRGGPEQAGFTPERLRHLGRLGDIDVVADPGELAVPASLRDRERRATMEDNLRLLREYAARPRRAHSCRVALRFLLSPTRILGHGRVQALELERNTLERNGAGGLEPRATGARATIPAGLVVSAVA